MSYMKRNPKGLPGRFGCDAIAVLAIISLLFPVSGSILCIAPGGHIAVEDINTACCLSSNINDRDENRPDKGLDTAEDCMNCTDFFLTPNRQGAIFKSCDNAVPNSLVDACLRNHILADIFSSLHQLVLINKIDAPSTLAASIPLRC
jgi:hypothetical protein